jgi:hypothetical protein
MAASGGRATKKASGSLNNVRPTPTSRAWVELSPIGDHRSIFCVAADYIPPVANGSDPTPMHNRIFDGCGRGNVHQLPVQRQTGVFCVCAHPNTREICRRNGLLEVGIWADGARTWTFNRVALTESTQSSRAEAAAGRSKSICDLV